MVVGCTRPYEYRQAKGCGRVTFLNEKIQTARYLSRTAGSLWAKRILRNLSPERSLALVHELERQGMATELDLEIPSWRTEQVISRSVTLEPASTILIPPAAPLEEDAHGWQPYRARELQGVTLDVDSGLVFAGERVIAQSGSGTRASRDAAFVSGARIRVSKTPPILVNGPIAPLGDVHHHYHVMLETLPRMLHARAVNPNVRFVTASVIPERYRKFFEKFDFLIEYYDPGSVLISHPLVLIDHPDLFWPRKADIAALRDLFGMTMTEPKRNLYASRGTFVRQPSHEKELQDQLRNAGFEILNLTSYPIESQWLIAQESNIVIGPHGASLWISAAMQPGTRLLEISSGDLFEGCYRRIATVNELTYRFLHLAGSESQPFGNGIDAAKAIMNC